MDYHPNKRQNVNGDFHAPAGYSDKGNARKKEDNEASPSDLEPKPLCQNELPSPKLNIKVNKSAKANRKMPSLI